MNKYSIKEETLINIGNAIREKTSTTEPINPKEMPQKIREISKGGDTLAELFLNKLTKYENKDVTSLPNYAFAGNEVIEEINLPNVDTMISSNRTNNSFLNCTKLKKVNLEKVKILKMQSFNGCTNLADIKLSNAESFESGAQSYGYTFCNVGSASTTPFKLILPKLVGLGIMTSTFAGCGASIISIPRCGNAPIYSSGFIKCENLRIVDLGKGGLGSNYFSGSSKLKIIILRRTTLVPMPAINIFNNTPFSEGGTGGVIYVPKDLINSYQTATNWSTLYNLGTVTFKSLEDSIYKELDWADDFELSSLESEDTE